jgi:diguanylate cyclase (GGDEF)-like protein
MRPDLIPDNTLEPTGVQAELDRLERGKGRGRPRLSLSFATDLEPAFLRHRAESVLMLQRIGMIIGMILYSIYFIHDHFTTRALADPQIWGTMMVFALPGNTALFIATFMREPWRYTLTVARVGALFHTAGMLALSTMAAMRGTELPFEFLIVQLLYDYFLLGLVWSEANVLAGLTVATAPLLMLMIERSGTQVFDFAFFVTSTAVLCSIGCHLQERAQRVAWLRAQLLQSLSERDPLTSVYNHRSFYSRGDKLIRQARREGRNVAVLGVDIDYFKRFNDVYGHLAGDECLRQVSAIVADHARRPLDMAGRLGGEEFAIFLYDTNRANALSRAEDLREAVKSLNIPGKVRITVSVGVATATPLDAVTMEAMVGQADVALYRAKHDQRDCVREWAADNKVRPSLQLVTGQANIG